MVRKANMWRYTELTVGRRKSMQISQTLRQDRWGTLITRISSRTLWLAGQLIHLVRMLNSGSVSRTPFLIEAEYVHK